MDSANHGNGSRLGDCRYVNVAVDLGVPVNRKQLDQLLTIPIGVHVIPQSPRRLGFEGLKSPAKIDVTIELASSFCLSRHRSRSGFVDGGKLIFINRCAIDAMFTEFLSTQHTFRCPAAMAMVADVRESLTESAGLTGNNLFMDLFHLTTLSIEGYSSGRVYVNQKL